MIIRKRGIDAQNAPKMLRLSPKYANRLSDVRRAALEDEVVSGHLREGRSYSGSPLVRGASMPTPAVSDEGNLRRGEWVSGHQASGVRSQGGLGAMGAVAHSPSYKKAMLMQKHAATIGTSGGGAATSHGASVERLAPEVYSPLFTMANLNLPRDRITINAWCFLSGTMVWMADGTRKPIEQVKIGDMVLSGSGVPRRVTALFWREVEEEVVGIKVKGSQETVWCTKNHGFNAVKANEVQCHDKCAWVNCKPGRGTKDGFCGRCGRKVNPYKFQKIAAGELGERDFVYMPDPKLEPVSDDPLLNSPDGMELLGYYAAQGCASKRQVIFTFETHKTKQIERVEQLLNKFFPEASVFKYHRKEQSVTRIYAYGEVLGNSFTDHCGMYIKRLSHQLVCADPKFLLSFLAAWMDGSGSQEKYNGKSFSGSTVSEQLAYQMRMIALRCGLVAHVSRGHRKKTMVSPTHGKTMAKYYVRFRGKSAVRFSSLCRSSMYRFGEVRRQHSGDGCSFVLNGKLIQWISSVSKKKHTGTVYNIEVEEDHTYTVGYGISVHNCRNFFDLHPIVRNAITLHATYPISKLNVKCADKKVEQFFADMIEEMDLMGALGDVALEYWKLGEAFPYAELDEETGKWRKIIVQNPDYIHVKKTVVASEPVISLRPDAVLQRLVLSNNPADIQLRKQIPEQVLYHVRKGQNIPLDNFNVSHLKMLSSPYDVRGTSVIVSAFKDLMLYDKLREAKFAQADGLVNPITLVKIGGTTEGEYHPTNEDIEFWRNIIEEAQYDKDFKLITHAGMSIERVGASGAVLDIGSDVELIIKNIHHGLMVPQAVIDTESAVYASASIGLEVLRQRYFNFRNMIAKWLVNKIFAPISEIQRFYTFEGGMKKLIVPEVEWNQMNLYDLQDYVANISSLVTTKQASLQTLYRSLGLSYEDERKKLREEAINDAIRQREEGALASMTLTDLRGLDPEQEIMEPLPNEGGLGAPGGAPGGDMGLGAGGPGGPGGAGGLGGLGGGGPMGMPELAPPPPGGEMGGAPAPGAGGATPPLGPGGPGGPLPI